MTQKGRIRPNSRRKPVSVVEEHRRNDGVIQNGAPVEQQAQAAGKVVAPAVHLGEPVDERFASNFSPSVQSRVESRPNLIDRVQLDGNQDVVAVAVAE